MYENVNIEVQEAISIALNYVRDIYSKSSFSISNILLEEIDKMEYNSHGECWFITIGFDEKDEPLKRNALDTIILSHQPRRKYKTVIIDKDGNVQAMKMHEVESVY